MNPCEDCHKLKPELYQRVRDGKHVCFTCLDATAPEQVNHYPGWRERMATKIRRAEKLAENLGRSR